MSCLFSPLLLIIQIDKANCSLQMPRWQLSQCGAEYSYLQYIYILHIYICTIYKTLFLQRLHANASVEDRTTAAGESARPELHCMMSSVCTEAHFNRLCLTTVLCSIYTRVHVHMCSFHSAVFIFFTRLMHLLTAHKQNPKK